MIAKGSRATLIIKDTVFMLQSKYLLISGKSGCGTYIAPIVIMVMYIKTKKALELIFLS
ncbi:MAG: hypothetical protein ACP5PO_02725 [Desulfurella sp.]|uniref:hypothetical protein n=1 Tax=Desulfurella sp. TaxID=1962857 RepID=UPI003D0A88EE